MRAVRAYAVRETGVAEHSVGVISFDAPVGAEVVSVTLDVNKLSQVVVHALVDDRETVITYNLKVFPDGAEVRGRYLATYRGYDLAFRHVFL